ARGATAAPVALATGDFDGDGKLDLAVVNDVPAMYMGWVSVLLNQGGGAFLAVGDYPTGPLSQSLAAGDFDGDGKPDLAVASPGDSPRYMGFFGSALSVLINQGGGTFAA